MSATPRPWYVGKDYYGGASIRTEPADATNIDGRGAVFENTGRGAGDMELEDCELIVAAVNACAALGFENPVELEAAVRELVGVARHMRQGFYHRHAGGGSLTGCPRCKMLAAADVALARFTEVPHD